MVSSRFSREGDIVAMMHVFVLPPSESCNNRVSFDSLLSHSISRSSGAIGEILPAYLYGTCELFSTSALMTRPKVNRL